MELSFSMFSFSESNIFELWRIITSLFIHANASHLFLNMLGLYFFGRITEGELKTKIWIIVYFVSGIMGNILHALTSSHPVVGASGCVFGMLGASMLLKPQKTIRMYVFPLPLGIIAILFAIAETMLVYYPNSSDNIAHISHVAGLIIGSSIIFFKTPKRSMKGVLWLIAFIVILALIGPIFGLMIGLGNFIISIVDMIAGFILYGIAYTMSFLWVL